MTRIFTFGYCKMVALKNDLEGVTAMEYGLLAATTVVVGLAAIGTIGPQLAGVFTSISNALPAA
jgi:pilus assembly protein Flp/PilA